MWAGFEFRNSTVPKEFDEYATLVRQSHEDDLEAINTKWRNLFRAQMIGDSTAMATLMMARLDKGKFIMESDMASIQRETAKAYIADMTLLKLSLASWNTLEIPYDKDTILEHVKLLSTLDFEDPPGGSWPEFKNKLIDDILLVVE